MNKMNIFPYLFPINTVSNDCNRGGGGVAFLLSQRVKFVVRPDLCDGNIESLWIYVRNYIHPLRDLCCFVMFLLGLCHSMTFLIMFVAECDTAFLTVLDLLFLVI